MRLMPELLGKPPCCGSCLYGRQVKKPDGTTTTSKNPETTGGLKKDVLVPGQRIYSDQLESSVRGRLFHTAGKEQDKDRFCGASLFVDGASGYIHVECQVTLNAADSIVAKENFERDLSHMGVTVQSYHTDNGIYKSKAYTEELVSKSQSIRFSGVPSEPSGRMGSASPPSILSLPLLAL